MDKGKSQEGGYHGFRQHCGHGCVEKKLLRAMVVEGLYDGYC